MPHRNTATANLRLNWKGAGENKDLNFMLSLPSLSSSDLLHDINVSSCSPLKTLGKVTVS